MIDPQVREQVDRVAEAQADVQSALWALQREIVRLDVLTSNQSAGGDAQDSSDSPR